MSTPRGNGADRAPSEADATSGYRAPFQSPGSADDDALADSLAIDGAVDGHDAPAADLPTAASPPPPRDQGRHRPGDAAAAETTRFEPVSPEAARPGSGGGDPSVAGPAATTPLDAPLDAPPDAPPDAVVRGPAEDHGGRGRRKRRKAPWWELPLLVAVAILIAVLVKTFVIQPFYIPSQSMEKTLHGCPGCKGDRILVNKPIYDLRDPHPGDIVVFNAPSGWNDEPPSVPPSNPVLKGIRGFGQLVGVVPPDGLVLVKRVIAIGGQTVKGDAAGHVMVSDHGTVGPWRTLDEPYVYEDGADSHASFGPITIPKKRLWVMGDHRNDSADSRFHCGTGGAQGPDGADCDATSATVPDSAVIGKAVLIAWPPSRWRTLGTPATFKHTADATLPLGGGALVVFPVYLVRRRRRRG